MRPGCRCEQHVLDGALAGQVQGAFGVPDVVGVAEGLTGVAVGELPAEFVDEEESDDEEQLADEGRSGRCVRLPDGYVRFPRQARFGMSIPRPLYVTMGGAGSQ